MTTSTRRSFWSSLSIAVGLLILVGIGASLVAPRQYEAFALLKVSERPPTVLSKDASKPEEFGVFKRTQAQLINSKLVLQPVARDPQIASLATIKEHGGDAEAWLQEGLIVDFPDDSMIMRISLKGRNEADLPKIVNKVVDAYLSEIVQRERDRRLEQEAKLSNTLRSMAGELTKHQEALRALESLHKTTDSEVAKLKRDIAMRELDQMMVHRTHMLVVLEENAMQIMLARASQDEPADVRTVYPTSGFSDRRAGPLSLPMLERQKAFLDDQLKTAAETIEKQVEKIEGMTNFSTQVMNKQEELLAQRKITSNLRGELDHMRIENLAPERVTKLADATLTSSHPRKFSRYAPAVPAALLGLALVAVGFFIRRRVES